MHAIESSPEFVSQVKRLLDTPRKPVMKTDHPRPPTLPPGFKQAGRKTEEEGQRAGDSTTVRKSGLPRWTWGALTAVIIGVVAALSVSRKSEPSPTAVPANPAPSSLLPAPSLHQPAFFTRMCTGRISRATRSSQSRSLRAKT